MNPQNFAQWLQVGALSLAGLGIALHGVAQILQAFPGNTQAHKAGVARQDFDDRLQALESKAGITK